MRALPSWLRIAATLLVSGVSVHAQRPVAPPVLDVAGGEKLGRELTAEILSQQPTRPFSATGEISIRGAGRPHSEIPVQFQIVPSDTNWLAIYQAAPTNGAPAVKLTVVHNPGQPCLYKLESGDSAAPRLLTGKEAMVPFAGSDFWLADLGLEFLHWPRQVVLGRQMCKNQSCYVLQSTNPDPAPAAYSRVVSWLDIQALLDSGQAAILDAEAYDSSNNVIKEFNPKAFKKVNGEWQLQEMDMDNRLTGSKTRIEFNLDSR